MIEKKVPPYITINALLTFTEAGDTKLVEVNGATPLNNRSCLTFEIDAYTLKCIALSAPRAKLSAFDEDTKEGIDEEEEAIAKELQRGLPYPELRYRKDRKSIGFKYHDGDGRQKLVSKPSWLHDPV